ncbi:MAG: SIMPL domain-containing protein [Anaerolineaceae bacterium]|nr:SIMPL domain-containing protein [Anaerolineaceae bacterium]
MNKKTITALLATLLVGATVLTACAQLPVKAQTATPESAATPQTSSGPIRTLSVTGNGKVTLVPDIAYINIGVHSEAEDVSSALKQNNELAKKIADALVASGVEQKDIQTANFNIYPKTNYDPQTGSSTPAGYSVDNTVYVTVRDLKQLGSLLDTAIQAGANQIYGISFDIKDRQAAVNTARNLAIKDAQEKAVEVAKVSNVALGQVQVINVSDSSYVQPFTQGYGGAGGATMAKSMDESVPVSAGQIVITFSANLIYAIN